MTDRRIERSIASQVAAMEARVRGLEALIGGGTQRAIQEEAIDDLAQTAASATYQDLSDTPGPQVTINVGRIGIAQFLVSATPWPTARENVDELEEVRIVLELSGANAVSAAQWETDYGYMSLLVELHGHTADAVVAIIGSVHRAWIISGLAPGETTATMKYSSTYGQVVNVNNRHLLGMPF